MTSSAEGMLRDWVILDVEATPAEGWYYDRDYSNSVMVAYRPHVTAIGKLGTRENVELVLRSRRDAPRMAQTLRLILAIDPADAATSIRDYGRGYAQAIRDVVAIIDKTWEDDA